VLLGAPELHHFHHAKLRDTRHNFANLAPWLDLVFRTYHRPAPDESFAMGLVEPFPKGYLAQLAQPFRFDRSASPGAEREPSVAVHSRETAE
jgi:sterol desaturase/sphingolipid hydroxylase (fatty acid hydroxylase superfamily)